MTGDWAVSLSPKDASLAVMWKILSPMKKSIFDESLGAQFLELSLMPQPLPRQVVQVRPEARRLSHASTVEGGCLFGARKTVVQ